MVKSTLISKIVKFSVIGAAVSLGSLALAGGADAATFTLPAQTASYPGSGTTLDGTTNTNFTNLPVSPNLFKFDSSLGTLQSVKVTLNGLVAGRARIESEDASPVTITTNQSAAITFSVTGVGNVVQVIPLASQSFNASAFDGNMDFGGTSGITYQNLTANDNRTVTLTSASALAAFIGGANDFLPAFLTGTGASNAQGSGNVTSNFNTRAGGTVTVEYTYSTQDAVATPEPGTILGLATVAGLGLLKQKKAS